MPPPSENSADKALLAERLRKRVDCLAGLIGPRHLGKPAAFEAAAGYVEREFRAIGETVEREWYEVDGRPVSNVVVTRTGTTRPGEVVILGAHYDTVSSTPGADDNASAVAVLIEATRQLHALSPQRTVRFVAFACEEPPHFYTDTMGSQVHARGCRARNERIVGMLCLEMVGYYTTAPGSQQAPPGIPRWLRWAFPKRGDFLAAVGNMRSLRLLWNFRRGFKQATRFLNFAPRSNFGDPPVGQQLLLGPGLPGPDADRHQLPAQSALPRSQRYSRDTRLRTDGRSDTRRCGRGEPTGAVSIVRFDYTALADMTHFEW